jgi:hypothetical protein
MTIKRLVVHFRRDLDDHEAERTIAALMITKGVSRLSPIAAGYEDRQRVKRELRDRMRALLDDE